ncbi:diguanylate cyclase domain-containing protein [Micromonospora sp. NPDC050397]|uniref:diguanylate cyclase domain-containing protein n=1 Tax=Micromonospora sp. NPDC050397 TaxID=3364279 RepID=UPI00384D238E
MGGVALDLGSPISCSGPPHPSEDETPNNQLRRENADLRERVARLEEEVRAAENLHLRNRIAQLEEDVLAARWEAAHDPLTGLLNRAGFLDHLVGLGWDKVGAYLMVDVDDFKQVNDLFGHDIGDAVLSTVAQRLAAVEGLIIARIGGDEFAGVVIGQPTGWQRFEAVAKEVVRAIAVPMEIRTFLLQVMASVGVAHIDQPASFDETHRRADAAMYRAKELPGRVARWTPTLDNSETEQHKALASTVFRSGSLPDGTGEALPVKIPRQRSQRQIG